MVQDISVMFSLMPLPMSVYDLTFKSYLAKKRAESKHYYVALSHAARKLVRVFYRIQLTGESYQAA